MQTEKQDLAGRLNILPRQVELWSQNRRARCKTLDDLREVIACEMDIRCIRDYSAWMQDEVEAHRGGVLSASRGVVRTYE